MSLTRQSFMLGSAAFATIGIALDLQLGADELRPFAEADDAVVTWRNLRRIEAHPIVRDAEIQARAGEKP